MSPYRTPGRRDEQEPAPLPEGDFRLQTWVSHRTCPGCREQMFAARGGGVRIDGCDGCGGAWLSRLEIDRIVDKQSAMAAILAGLSEADPEATPEPLFAEDTRRCPECSGLLLARRLPGVDRADVWHVHGIFFDARELESYVEQTLGRREARPARVAARPLPRERVGESASFEKIFEGLIARFTRR
jgi:Zn-finger nucleic acid-binding protein